MVEIKTREAGEAIREELIPIELAEKWVGIYIKQYGQLPSDDYFKSRRRKLEILLESTIYELAAILALRPKFLDRYATPGQIEWLKKMR